MRSLRAAAAATLLLAGCAAPGFTLTQQSPEFELSGRIAVSYRDQATTGNVAWRHGAGSDEMLITTPLGQGFARLVRADGEFTLTTQEGREFKAADAESLTEQALGFRLPLAGLTDWVRGRASPPPASESSRVRRDAAGRLAELEQSGWTIRYLEYNDALPSRLTLSYPGLELRLAISEWK